MESWAGKILTIIMIGMTSWVLKETNENGKQLESLVTAQPFMKAKMEEMQGQIQARQNADEQIWVKLNDIQSQGYRNGWRQ